MEFYHRPEEEPYPATFTERYRRVLRKIRPPYPGDIWADRCGEWSGKLRCTALKAHREGQHHFVSAGWYQFVQVGIVPKNWVLRPKNSDYQDLTWDNWEAVPRKGVMKAAYAQPEVRVKRGWKKLDGIWHKTCTECSRTLPVERFVERRNQCVACYAEINREKRRASYDTHARQGCIVFRQKHYHVGLFGEPKTSRQLQAASDLAAAQGLRSQRNAKSREARATAKAAKAQTPRPGIRREYTPEQSA